MSTMSCLEEGEGGLRGGGVRGGGVRGGEEEGRKGGNIFPFWLGNCFVLSAN